MKVCPEVGQSQPHERIGAVDLEELEEAAARCHQRNPIGRFENERIDDDRDQAGEQRRAEQTHMVPHALIVSGKERRKEPSGYRAGGALSAACDHPPLTLRPAPPMPREQPPPQRRHQLDDDVADRGDFDDAGEHAAGIGEARGLHHRGAEAVAAHRHLDDDGDDQRDRQRHLQAGENLRRRRRQQHLPHDLDVARAHVAGRPDEFLLDTGDAGDHRRHHRKYGVDGDHGDLGDVIEAEPEDHHRQERDLRHREADRDHGVEEPPCQRAARHRGAEQDAGEASR